VISQCSGELILRHRSGNHGQPDFKNSDLSELTNLEKKKKVLDRNSEKKKDCFVIERQSVSRSQKSMANPSVFLIVPE
jgi:hypothetical protein